MERAEVNYQVGIGVAHFIDERFEIAKDLFDRLTPGYVVAAAEENDSSGLIRGKNSVGGDVVPVGDALTAEPSVDSVEFGEIIGDFLPDRERGASDEERRLFSRRIIRADLLVPLNVFFKRERVVLLRERRF